MGMFNSYYSILVEYLRNTCQTGAISPDSRSVVKAFCHRVPRQSSVIVEYGSGTGTISREIIKKMHPSSTLFCFEKNPRLYDFLQTSLSVGKDNVIILNSDAFNSSEVLAKQYKLAQNSIDYLISTLPGSFLDYEKLIEKTIAPLLKTNGIFVTYQYIPSKLRYRSTGSILRNHFHEVTSQHILLNLPPATVYICRKK